MSKTKKCNKCNNDKPISEFYFRKSSGKYRSSCKDCVKEGVKKYAQNNKEKISLKNKERRVKNKLKNTNAEYPKNASKTCCRCKKEKLLSDFVRDCGSADGFGLCKKCSSTLQKEYRERNPEKMKEFGKKSREKNKKKNRDLNPHETVCLKRCSTCGIIKSTNDFSIYRAAPSGLSYSCKECSAKANKIWRENNKDYLREFDNNRRKDNISRRIGCQLRSRLWYALRGIGKKVGSSIGDLGCSVDELKQHLEKQFYSHPKTGEQMTWENYGFYGWHIDHVKSLASFDLTNRSKFLEACHYTNLQPLWAEENLSKGAKLDWEKE